jgi:hypothetical protein
MKCLWQLIQYTCIPHHVWRPCSSPATWGCAVPCHGDRGMDMNKHKLCHSGLCLFLMVGQNSVVSVATRYALDSLGSESQWRWDYPHPSSLALKPTQLPEQWVPGLFPWSKMDRVWCWPLTPYSDEVKERVELYLYSPCGSSCSVVGWTLFFCLLCLMYDNVTNVKC